MVQSEKALDDLVILDLSNSIAAAWCTRLFADFGAKVIMIEPPSGNPLRYLYPEYPEGSNLLVDHLLANKKSLQLDIENTESRQLFLDLIAKCDVIVESSVPSQLEEYGLGFDDLHNSFPDLIVLSVTPYGRRNEYTFAPANSLSIAARSGWASINGFEEKGPLSTSINQSAYCSGVLAYGSTLAAIFSTRQKSGCGQYIDISEFEVMVSNFAPPALSSEYSGNIHKQKSMYETNLLAGPVPVQDGHFALTLSRAHFFRDAMMVLGLEDLAENLDLHETWYRMAHKDLWMGRVQDAMSKWTREELFDELALRRVVAGPVLKMDELVENVHLQQRGFWNRLQDDPLQALRPGAPFKLSETPWVLEHMAPDIGEHDEELAQMLLHSSTGIQSHRGEL
tara:strand:- start:29439 stop:30623 length:1185 start_codon:yes stop_codon:yes gene_type:complete